MSVLARLLCASLPLALGPACQPGQGVAEPTDAGADGGALDAGQGDGGPGDGGAVDGGGVPPTQTYPTGTTILLSYGHGGLPPQTTGEAAFTAVAARWSALGYSLHHKSSLPTDLSAYRLIGLVAPGAVEAVAFSEEERERIATARRGGARVLILGDPTMCGSAELAALLDALGTDAGFSGEAADSNQVIVSSELSATSQPTAGLSTLRTRDPCYVRMGGGEWLARAADGRLLASRHLPADGGDIVILGDLEVLDDGYLDREDNAGLADNLARIEP